MIQIKPMDEGYVHQCCLHDGPIDTTALEHAPDALPGGHPPRPWSDETLCQVVARYHAEGISHPWPAEFSREMIRRYGTCAILAWEGPKVVGHLWFYPMKIARLLTPADAAAWGPVQEEGTLWVQCVMSSRPYVGSDEDTVTGRHWPAKEKAGARRGVGLKLVQGLISWARNHGWKRIVKVAHSDLDCLYGQLGGGGKAFWQKAGFAVVATHCARPDDWSEDFMALAGSQMAEKGMTEREAWTWHHMTYEL